jgi:hypothetical protein
MLLKPAIIRSSGLTASGRAQECKEFTIFYLNGKIGMIVTSPYFFTTFSILIALLINILLFILKRGFMNKGLLQKIDYATVPCQQIVYDFDSFS